MYERANRFFAGRTVVAGAFVLAFGLYDSVAVQPVLAQTIGQPNVIVDETVLEQLGPAPQTLPDVILQQQPQAYRPAPRHGATPLATEAMPSTDQLLPPPSAMPRSRVMLPRALKPAQPVQPSPASPPQVARVPQAAPKPPAAPAKKAPVVPTEITPPPVARIPEAPKVAPPPAPRVEAPTASEAKPPAAVPQPVEPPVARVEPPELPAAPLPKVEPPAPPVAEAPVPVAPQPVTPPAPPVAATPAPVAPPAAPTPERPETAAIPAPPAIVPPAPAAEAEAPPAPSAAEKETAPPQLSATAPDPEPRQEPSAASTGRQTGTQMAALPPSAAPAEILDDGQLYRIPFGTESSDIPEDGRKYLDELARKLKSDSSLRLQILGYAGSTQDSASKARRASLFRALSVRTYLMKQGIRSTRMDVRALGNLVEDGAPDRVDAVVRK